MFKMIVMLCEEYVEPFCGAETEIVSGSRADISLSCTEPYLYGFALPTSMNNVPATAEDTIAKMSVSVNAVLFISAPLGKAVSLHKKVLVKISGLN